MPIPAGLSPSTPLTHYETMRAIGEVCDLNSAAVTVVAVAAIAGIGLVFAGFTAAGVTAFAIAAPLGVYQGHRTWKGIKTFNGYDSPMEFAFDEGKAYLMKSLLHSPRLRNHIASMYVNLPDRCSYRVQPGHPEMFQFLCENPAFQHLSGERIFSSSGGEKETLAQSAVITFARLLDSTPDGYFSEELSEGQVVIFRCLIKAGCLEELSAVTSEKLTSSFRNFNDLVAEQRRRHAIFTGILTKAKAPPLKPRLS